jgi:hypothetical protein
MTETAGFSSTASIQMGAARADGRLSLSATQLKFEPFNKTLPLGPYTFELSDIVLVEKCLGKGAGFIPVTTEAMRIVFNNDKKIEFIVSETQEWINKLQQG